MGSVVQVGRNYWAHAIEMGARPDREVVWLCSAESCAHVAGASLASDTAAHGKVETYILAEPGWPWGTNSFWK